jgi:succinate dehydrogenase / fumarate reductase membrane anchor subunit
MSTKTGERSADFGSLDLRSVRDAVKAMTEKQMRSPLGRAIGLGSAKEGVDHWWRERVTAVALIPLMLWFVASIIAHSGDGYGEFVDWLKTPVATLMMILVLIALFSHAALGLQVIIEDYVHSVTKIPTLVLMRLICFALAAVGILAVLRIAFGD